jgi:hypothetical protein
MFGQAPLELADLVQQRFLRPVAFDPAGGDEAFVKLTGGHLSPTLGKAKETAGRDKVSVGFEQATQR